jgi:hypothetical protein
MNDPRIVKTTTTHARGGTRTLRGRRSCERHARSRPSGRSSSSRACASAPSSPLVATCALHTSFRLCGERSFCFFVCSNEDGTAARGSNSSGGGGSGSGSSGSGKGASSRLPDGSRVSHGVQQHRRGFGEFHGGRRGRGCRGCGPSHRDDGAAFDLAAQDEC